LKEQLHICRSLLFQQMSENLVIPNIKYAPTCSLLMALGILTTCTFSLIPPAAANKMTKKEDHLSNTKCVYYDASVWCRSSYETAIHPLCFATFLRTSTMM